MKPLLMYQDRHFDLDAPLPPNGQALTDDLELNMLFNAMALDDQFLFEVARRTILSAVDNTAETILYRQDILKDCLKNPSVVIGIYNVATKAIEEEKGSYFRVYGRFPTSILHNSLSVLQMFVGKLRELKRLSEQYSVRFESRGFKTFFAMIENDLNDEYINCVENHLNTLEFQDGILLSAELGPGNMGTKYILRKPHDSIKKSWFKRIFTKKPPAYSFQIPDRDDSGINVLTEMRNRGINLVANTVAQSTDHILAFFKMLRTELAFYIGCLNLYNQLAKQGEPRCFPQLASPGERKHIFTGLYDICLALRLKRVVVGNDLAAVNKNLVIITGANQGGKSTFLRSMSIAQLMMQCGMFVPAEEFCASVYNRLFTHYKREEDPTMKSGKLDEELSRMSVIIDNISQHSLVLLNESFAATNDAEGSEIAGQIVGALAEKGIMVVYVTHLYTFARRFYEKRMDNVIFLRAERHIDGSRSYKLREGEPLPTSYGKDLYEQIFGGSHDC